MNVNVREDQTRFELAFEFMTALSPLGNLPHSSSQTSPLREDTLHNCKARSVPETAIGDNALYRQNVRCKWYSYFLRPAEARGSETARQRRARENRRPSGSNRDLRHVTACEFQYFVMRCKSLRLTSITARKPSELSHK
jgi:hypothetical protein